MCDSVLQFDGVSFIAAVQAVEDLDEASFSLSAGELLLVRAQSRRDLPIADLASGVADADRGVVGYRGQSWMDRGVGEASEARGTIGRVFSGTAWISNLTVYENVVLRVRHHGCGMTAKEIHEAAEGLAAQVGLDQVSMSRPGVVLAGPLQRAAWIRAFLGKPALILLEYPEAGVEPGHWARLQGLVKEARERGAAVLWITGEDATWASRDLMATCRMEYERGRLAGETIPVGSPEG